MAMLAEIFFLPFLLTSVWGGRCQLKFTTVRNLKVCDFSTRDLSTLQNVNIPRDCQGLDLSRNKLSRLEDFLFIDLPKLLYLDISENSLTQLSSKTFAGLERLVCLDLRHNMLNYSYVAFPVEVFLPLSGLKILDIGKNIQDDGKLDFPDKVLAGLVSIEEIRLELKSDMQLGPGFAGLFNLTTLVATAGYSRLTNLKENFFEVFQNVNVTSLILENCKIKTIETGAFTHFKHLNQISLAQNHHLGLNNALKALRDLREAPLKVINFSLVNSQYADQTERRISVDMVKSFNPFCLESLDVSDNLLYHIDSSFLRQLNSTTCLRVFRFKNANLQNSVLLGLFVYSSLFRKLVEIDASNTVVYEKNPGNDLYWDGNRNVKRQAENVFEVSLPPSLRILNISGDDFNCDFKYDIFRIYYGSHLEIVDFSYSPHIGCFHRKLIGIENLKMAIISGALYENTLNSVFLSSFPVLEHLEMRDVPLMKRFSAEPFLFHSLTNLKHLDIGNSGLSVLQEKVFEGLSNLKTLVLTSNKLVQFPDLTVLPTSLVLLNLKDNALVQINKEGRQALESITNERGLFTVLIDENTFACNCDIFTFVHWVWTTNVTLDKGRNYQCVIKNGSIVPLMTLKHNFHDLQVRCISSFWITFGAFGVSVIMLVFFGSTIVYRYRVPIKYWCHTMCRKPEGQPDRLHKYDVLIAYCFQDYRWACQTLLPKLTQGEQPYKVCVYDRDFVPGVSIEENIISAINESYKVILVISPAFVESTWCMFEIQMARMKMIQEGREDVVIPIILEDVPVTAMPKSLLNLWNTSVFLVWSDSVGEQKHFWTNLMAALGPSRIQDLQEMDYREDPVHNQIAHLMDADDEHLLQEF